MAIQDDSKLGTPITFGAVSCPVPDKSLHFDTEAMGFLVNKLGDSDGHFDGNKVNDSDGLTDAARDNRSHSHNKDCSGGNKHKSGSSNNASGDDSHFDRNESGDNASNSDKEGGDDNRDKKNNDMPNHDMDDTEDDDEEDNEEEEDPDEENDNDMEEAICCHPRVADVNGEKSDRSEDNGWKANIDTSTSTNERDQKAGEDRGLATLKEATEVLEILSADLRKHLHQFTIKWGCTDESNKLINQPPILSLTNISLYKKVSQQDDICEDTTVAGDSTDLVTETSYKPLAPLPDSYALKRTLRQPVLHYKLWKTNGCEVANGTSYFI